MTMLYQTFSSITPVRKMYFSNGVKESFGYEKH